MTTHFHRTFDPCTISLSCPPPDRINLPAPTILGPAYTDGNLFCLDLRGHDEKQWTLAALSRKALRGKLRYFKSFTREMLDAALVALANIEPPISKWQQVKAWKCANCGEQARRNLTTWGCPKCKTKGEAEGDLWVKVVVVKKPKTALESAIATLKAAKASSAPSPGKPSPSRPKQPAAVDEPPKVGMSLKERMAANKAKKA